MSKECEVMIIGGGIGGLTLALALHDAGIDCRVYEAAPELRPLGVGINILPHATRVLGQLGMNETLGKIGIATKEAAFFNVHGQLIFREPAGVAAGYATPQFSIHRGDLQMALLAAVQERLGKDAVVLDRRCVSAASDDTEATVTFVDAAEQTHVVKATVAVSCEGLHSALRKQFYPNEGAPKYSGINMWRGAVHWDAFLSGATMVRAGALMPGVGKMVIYPIRDNVDAQGRQLVNWVAEIESPQPAQRDWNKAGRLEDFIHAFKDWHFDWLDVTAMMEATTGILQFPMVDQDPLPTWTFGRLTLLGDAAHPMVPRGSNGAGQSILDADVLRNKFVQYGVGPEALLAYDKERVKATTDVVLTNRKAPPDKILNVVHERTQGKPFTTLEGIIDEAELRGITANYKQVAGYTVEGLKAATGNANGA
ncbi:MULTISPECIES: flavin-dependent oxidoreductase [unclassified Cupriavidus]|uniref:flavin-dependent oxidoreductase n=1 Tax=unclassified Cupriavidus TaxID=2640874 RepID=UPI00313C3C29